MSVKTSIDSPKRIGRAPKSRRAAYPAITATTARRVGRPRPPVACGLPAIGARGVGGSPLPPLRDVPEIRDGVEHVRIGPEVVDALLRGMEIHDLHQRQ